MTAVIPKPIASNLLPIFEVSMDLIAALLVPPLLPLVTITGLPFVEPCALPWAPPPPFRFSSDGEAMVLEARGSLSDGLAEMVGMGIDVVGLDRGMARRGDASARMARARDSFMVCSIRGCGHVHYSRLSWWTLRSWEFI